MTEPAILPASGVAATHGAFASTLKNIAPVNLTARNTSDKTSTPASTENIRQRHSNE
jgi:hypothetical protein